MRHHPFRFLAATALVALGLGACTSNVQEDTGTAVKPSADSAAASAAHAHDGPHAPDFSLPGSDGKTHSLAAYMAEGKTVVLEWFNPECPVVKGYHDPGTMLATQQKVAGPDVVWLAINSGGAGKQGHGVEKNQAALADWKLPYPVLFDESGTVGKAYKATNTPQMFVIRDGHLLYQGAIDDSKGAKAGTNYVVAAMEAIKAGKPVAEPATQAFGCSVKYAN